MGPIAQRLLDRGYYKGSDAVVAAREADAQIALLERKLAECESSLANALAREAEQSACAIKDAEAFVKMARAGANG